MVLTRNNIKKIACFRCGDSDPVRACPHTTNDVRKALKTYRVLIDGHKSNAGRAAETDSDSGSEDDDPDPDEQEEEDRKDTEIAPTYIGIQRTMAPAGHSKKAASREAKLPTRNRMYRLFTRSTP